MFAVAMAHYAAPQHNGRNVVFDGMANDEHGHPRDPTVVEAVDSVEIVVSDINLDRLRAYRQREVWGPSFRHPELYALLAAAHLSRSQPDQ